MSRRDEIIAAAMHIVNTEGADAMSVRNVAAKAGIGTSTLRYYFPSHRDLVDAVANAATAQSLSDLNIHDANIEAHVRLAQCLMQFLPRDTSQLPVLETLVAAYAACFKDGKPVGSPQLVSLADITRAQVEKWLNILAAEGHSLALEAADLARILIAHLHGVAIDLIIEAPHFSLEDAATEVTKVARLALGTEG